MVQYYIPSLSPATVDILPLPHLPPSSPFYAQAHTWYLSLCFPSIHIHFFFISTINHSFLYFFTSSPVPLSSPPFYCSLISITTRYPRGEWNAHVFFYSQK